MEGVTRKLAGGDYDTRSLDDREDELGRISKALNEMAGSLQKNFTELETRAWHQEGALQLSKVMRGESNLAVLAGKICKNMAGHLQAPVAALYTVADEEQAGYAGGYATSAAPPVINLKEGLVKEALLSGKLLQVNKVPPDYLKVTSALGNTTPACLLVVPLLFSGRPLGFIEMGLLQPPAPPMIQWLEGVTESVAISINSNLSLQRIQQPAGRNPGADGRTEGAAQRAGKHQRRARNPGRKAAGIGRRTAGAAGRCCKPTRNWKNEAGCWKKETN